jgi:type II secretory pathway pseudopilin PulG
MTLIEVMVATALLATVMALVGGWTLHQARLTERVRARAQRQQELAAVRDLLRDDLLQALQGGPGLAQAAGEQPQLSFPSLHRAPGDGGGAGATLTWRFDAARHALLRRRGDGPDRVLLEGLSSCGFLRTSISTTLSIDQGDGPASIALALAPP